MSRLRIPGGLYAITDESLPANQLFTRTEAILRGGARMLQYRDKQRRDAESRITRATELLALCTRHDALLIMNDDVELARDIGAAGVHIGRDDLSVARTRALLGADAIIGVSCYNDLALAEQAVAQGADYIAFGSFYPSPTKPDAVRAEIDLLVQARQFSVPVVAIGGITLENGPALVAAGANALAVITGVYQANDPLAAATAFSQLFSNPS